MTHASPTKASDSNRGALPDPLPLIGREADLVALRQRLEVSSREGGRTYLIHGDRGVGKSRLVEAGMKEARELGWAVASASAVPLGGGIPYALVSDAFVPLLRDLGESAVTALSRGGRDELAHLFPMLGPTSGSAASLQLTPDEFKMRLFWNFTEFLKSLARRRPILIVLEDLHWADQSSLELIHFVARHSGDSPILQMVTLSDADAGSTGSAQFAETLKGMPTSAVHHLKPLSVGDTGKLLQRIFGVGTSVTGEFTGLIHGWTRGNPFFLEETLRALIASGRLYRRADHWLGWEVAELDLPDSIRSAVLARLQLMSPAAQSTAALVAVAGTRVTHRLLDSVSDLPEEELLEGLDELRSNRILAESQENDRVFYNFTHTVIREVVQGEVGLVRSRILHGSFGEALEDMYGASAVAHADELAFHFRRADVRRVGPKAVRYLAAAGRVALERHANTEAVEYLSTAVKWLRSWEETTGEPEHPEDVDLADLIGDLARTLQRIGDYDGSIPLWEEALRVARDRGVSTADIRRRLGSACIWKGSYPEAREHFEAGLEEALALNDHHGAARLRLAGGVILAEAGLADQALDELQAAMSIAESIGDERLLAQTHRALLLHFLWTGPPEVAREHAEKAFTFSQRCHDKNVEYWSHWGLAVLEGLRGHTDEMSWQIERCGQLADELRSPVLRLWTAEVAIEGAHARGEWTEGVAIAERAIVLARSLHQRTLLPRLLVWASILYIPRGELERAKAYIDEAWELTDAGRAGSGPVAIHSALPAHIGRTTYYLAVGEYEEAIRTARAGIAMADKTGYVFWSLHRLLPLLGEAHLLERQLDEAEAVVARLTESGSTLSHELSIAWGDAGHALLRWLTGDSAGAAGQLLKAAEALESIPLIYDAARVRRQLAGRLAETGDRTGALQELRTVHETFLRLGARSELEKTREMFRENDARPPSGTTGEGLGRLSAREVQITRLAVSGKSDKGIARELSISPRTVGTHLGNIFRKLGVSSRRDLVAALAIEGGAAAGPDETAGPSPN